jgi:hypothetical protein
MNGVRLLMAGIGAILLSTLVPLRAHHSFAAQYDRNKPVTLHGVLTKLEWTNPHVYLYVDVKEPTGKVVSWAVEGGAPNNLYRAGWRKDSVAIGAGVTIDGFLARDGSKLANLRTLTLADGRRVFSN